VPVLVAVIVCAALVVPFACDPKFSDAGDNEIDGVPLLPPPDPEVEVGVGVGVEPLWLACTAPGNPRVARSILAPVMAMSRRFTENLLLVMMHVPGTWAGHESSTSRAGGESAENVPCCPGNRLRMSLQCLRNGHLMRLSGVTRSCVKGAKMSNTRYRPRCLVHRARFLPDRGGWYAGIPLPVEERIEACTSFWKPTG
jgi:hypothetical protein